MSTFKLTTYGCQMNKSDSEKIAGVLINLGYKPAKTVEDADLVVFNTCCVRKNADERLYGNLGHLKKLKAQKPNILIAVGGCLAQKDKTEVQQIAPHVDLVFGTHNISELPKLITSAKASKVCAITKESDQQLTDLPLKRENPYKAWVPIIIGCNNHCSYCIVPQVRGKEQSRRLEDIKKEINCLAKEGVLEITLLGQNVNSYGKDIYGKPAFAKLLGELNTVKQLKRIRFTTCHPKDLTADVIKAVGELEKVCEHIHLPVQAGSSRILKLMNRHYTKDQYLNLVKKIRREIPGVSLTTDIMVGFPTESEEDFKDTLDVVKDAHFDQAFTFIYSPRENTQAEKMPEQLDEKTKLKRFQKLIKLQNDLTLQSNQALEGEKVEVVVEGRSKKGPSMLFGRSRGNKIVNFKGEEKLIGQMLSIKIAKAFTWYLLGEIDDR